MSRPLAPLPAPPPTPPAEPEPRSRNARLLRSAIVFGSFLVSLILLKLAIPEIPTRPLVIASGALGGFFALDIFNIRQEENARELRARNRNGREAGQTAEIAPEQVIAEILEAPPTHGGIRRRDSASSLSSSSTDRSR